MRSLLSILSKDSSMQSDIVNGWVSYTTKVRLKSLKFKTSDQCSNLNTSAYYGDKSDKKFRWSFIALCFNTCFESSKENPNGFPTTSYLFGVFLPEFTIRHLFALQYKYIFPRTIYFMSISIYICLSGTQDSDYFIIVESLLNSILSFSEIFGKT